jgi:glycosyltransferase involved in cell wall biosynthesis
MRIVFDVSHIQKQRAGIGRYSAELLRSLLSADRVNEYILHGWSYSLDRESILELERDNVSLSLGRIPGPLRRFYWSRMRGPKLSRWLGSYDLFHSSDHFVPPLGEERSIVTVYDLASLKYPEMFEGRVLRWNRKIAKAVSRADAVIVPSAHTRADLCEAFSVPEEKVHVVAPPVPRIFSPAAGEGADGWLRLQYKLERPFALFVGTLEPRKNLISLIGAFEMLCDKIPAGQELDLVIVGKKGWLFEYILKAIATSRRKERILYLDYVPEKELPALYRLAEFFVYPSLYEGYGFPVMEAMACGTPVVTSNTSSMREIAEGVAVLVDPANQEALAEAMFWVQAETSRRDDLARRGLERARSGSPGDAPHKLIRLYERLLD